MMRHRPTGWNTWDFRGFNRLVYLHNGRTKIALLYAIWDEDVSPPTADSKQVGKLFDAFRWEDVTRFGPHAPLGLPAELELRAGGTAYRAEAVDRDSTLALTVRPLAETKQRVVFIFVVPLGETARVRSPESGMFGGCWVELEGASWPTDYFLNIGEPYAIGAPGQAASVRVAGSEASVAGARRSSPFLTPKGWGTQQSVAADVPSAGTRRDRSRGTTPCETPATTEHAHQDLVGQGALADAPQAMMRAVAWNTLYDTRRRLVSSPVSRDWCSDWRGVIVFCWDTYLAGAMASYGSPELARLNIEAVNAAIDELGFVPNYCMAHGAASLDRSMPPIGAYLVWKTQAAAPDVKWLKKVYPQLRRWHPFWMKNRDGNRNGLLSWGSNAEPAYDFPQLVPYNPTLRHSAPAAKWESGLDNSPMYDDVPFNKQTNTLELDDVALSSYYAMDCESLAALAECLGRERDAAAYREEYQAIKQRINELLWDEEHGIFCNRHWDGRLSRRWSPTSFFPLIAGVAPRDRAERMIREHLLNEDEFWGEYVLPSIARNDPAYADNDYWRGRIWGPFNFLVAEGLRRYRFDDTVAELARRSLEMFRRNWHEDGGVYENYNAETGRGGDVRNSARFYHWGGLLALVAIQELIDVEAAGCLRFGSVTFPDAGVRKVRVGGASYDVNLHQGLSVSRNGQPLLECNTRAIVRLPSATLPDQPIEISAPVPGRLRLWTPGGPERPARVNRRTTTPATQDGVAVYNW